MWLVTLYTKLLAIFGNSFEVYQACPNVVVKESIRGNASIPKCYNKLSININPGSDINLNICQPCTENLECLSIMRAGMDCTVRGCLIECQHRACTQTYSRPHSWCITRVNTVCVGALGNLCRKRKYLDNVSIHSKC